MENLQHKSARKQKLYSEKISEDLGTDALKGMQKEEDRKQKKEARKNEIKQSQSYRTIETIKVWMDDRYLDGFIGLIPIAGDAVTQIFSIPFIYVSLVKIKSIPLTLAIVFNILLDFLIGLIPYFIGNIADFFFKSHKRNFQMIVGFVEDDREVIQKVNKKAIGMAIGIFVVCYSIYKLISYVVAMVSWVFDLFS